MSIQHRSKGPKGVFIIEEDNEMVAELVYAMSGDNMIIEHTEVDEELRGQDFGFELIQAAVEHARSHHLKILPVCRFAKAVFDKKPDFGDVLNQ